MSHITKYLGHDGRVRELDDHLAYLGRRIADLNDAHERRMDVLRDANRLFKDDTNRRIASLEANVADHEQERGSQKKRLETLEGLEGGPQIDVHHLLDRVAELESDAKRPLSQSGVRRAYLDIVREQGGLPELEHAPRIKALEEQLATLDKGAGARLEVLDEIYDSLRDRVSALEGPVSQLARTHSGVDYEHGTAAATSVFAGEEPVPTWDAPELTQEMVSWFEDDLDDNTADRLIGEIHAYLRWRWSVEHPETPNVGPPTKACPS